LILGGSTTGYKTGTYTTGGYTTGGYVTGTGAGNLLSGPATGAALYTATTTGGQGFASGAHGTGSNYAYTSGGPLETSTFTTGGYAQPLSTAGYVTKDGTHLSTSGQVLNAASSLVKNNVSYQTNAS